MPQYLAALLVVVLVGTVLARVLLLRRTGTRAVHFGELDNTDFAIPPFALFYFYTVFAAAFGWPVISTQRFFRSTVAAWVGVGLCATAVVVLVASLVSFGKSFRIGIDVDKPGGLVTTGIFAVSRNPIYVGFFLFLLGQLLVFPNWVPLICLVVGAWLFNRQVLREEEFMREHYGKEYLEYCERVRRYV
ncbi:isoprenylcysteine carboxyl methyltransferase [Mycobacterium asiaticum]|uniref:Isoprenylcysteine carboxyl methyltransferase n=2 Tax=Mycobacterium asiaticum TaxID=1790 RepID=A0A1A3NNV0_MYCAS|nr:isoprenylcysteine carboxyl methyltransferase [Mycobacterium asiaticum]